MSLQLKLDCEVQHGMFVFSALFSKCFKQDAKQNFYFKIMLLGMGELQLGETKNPKQMFY